MTDPVQSEWLPEPAWVFRIYGHAPWPVPGQFLCKQATQGCYTGTHIIETISTLKDKITSIVGVWCNFMGQKLPAFTALSMLSSEVLWQQSETGSCSIGAADEDDRSAASTVFDR